MARYLRAIRQQANPNPNPNLNPNPNPNPSPNPNQVMAGCGTYSSSRSATRWSCAATTCCLARTTTAATSRSPIACAVGRRALTHGATGARLTAWMAAVCGTALPTHQAEQRRCEFSPRLSPPGSEPGGLTRGLNSQRRGSGRVSNRAGTLPRYLATISFALCAMADLVWLCAMAVRYGCALKLAS